MLEIEKLRSLSIFRYEFGFGFESLYHPYLEAIKLKNEKQGAELLKEFSVRMGEYLYQLPVAERLNIQLWKLDDNRIQQALKNYQGIGQYHMHLGKSGLDEAVRKKAKQLYSIKESIEKFGYLTIDGGVKGPKLDGKYMIVLGGQNRAVVLVGMGWNKVPARFSKPSINIPRSIQLKDVELLPLVQRQVMSKEVAINVLLRIKQGFTKERARSYNFPFA